MGTKKTTELTEIEKAKLLLDAENKKNELADNQANEACMKEVEAVLKKHGRTIVSPVNHYMFLLMEKKFNENPDTVLNNPIRVVKAAKE